MLVGAPILSSATHSSHDDPHVLAGKEPRATVGCRDEVLPMHPTLRTAVSPFVLATAVWLTPSCATTDHGDSATPYDDLPYAPHAQVLDTTSSLGPLGTEPQHVSLGDLVAWHGHPCDGLVASAAGIVFGLTALFPDSPVDRTDLCAAVNRSACYGDVAAFLTGARHRYGSLVIDPELGDCWILHRRTTGTTVRISLRAGIKPAELPGLEAELRDGRCPPELMARVEELQDRFARRLLETAPEELFVIEPLDAYPYPLGERRPDTLKRDCPTRGAQR